MQTTSIIIKRKELMEFYIDYIQNHTYIKSKHIAWDYLRSCDNFSRGQLQKMTPKLSRKLQYFCMLALENKIIIPYTTSMPNITYKIDNIGNLSLLKEQLENLKEKTFEVEIPIIFVNHHSKNLK